MTNYDFWPVINIISYSLIRFGHKYYLVWSKKRSYLGYITTFCQFYVHWLTYVRTWIPVSRGWVQCMFWSNQPDYPNLDFPRNLYSTRGNLNKWCYRGNYSVNFKAKGNGPGCCIWCVKSESDWDVSCLECVLKEKTLQSHCNNNTARLFQPLMTLLSSLPQPAAHLLFYDDVRGQPTPGEQPASPVLSEGQVWGYKSINISL